MTITPRPATVSNWTVAGLLAKLPRFRRVDRGAELLAFRLAGNRPGRTAYVYLYGEDPADIHFVLDADGSEVEGEHGCARTEADLALVLRWWLAELAETA